VYLAAWDVASRQNVRSFMNPAMGSPFDRLASNIMSSEPYRSATRVFWIMDNGSGHRGSKAIRRLQTQWPTLIPVRTTVHASWLHPVEIYFSILQRKVLTPNDFTSLAQLENHLLQFQEHYQQIAAPLSLDLRTQGSGCSTVPSVQPVASRDTLSLFTRFILWRDSCVSPVLLTRLVKTAHRNS
jgi:hypothetical protein